jgi:hypothetical protein
MCISHVIKKKKKKKDTCHFYKLGWRILQPNLEENFVFFFFFFFFDMSAQEGGGRFELVISASLGMIPSD